MGPRGFSLGPLNPLFCAINGKQDKLTFDTMPTSGSSNPVTSGGVYTAINNAGGVVNGEMDITFNKLWDSYFEVDISDVTITGSDNIKNYTNVYTGFGANSGNAYPSLTYSPSEKSIIYNLDTGQFMTMVNSNVSINGESSMGGFTYRSSVNQYMGYSYRFNKDELSSALTKSFKGKHIFTINSKKGLTIQPSSFDLDCMIYDNSISSFGSLRNFNYSACSMCYDHFSFRFYYNSEGEIYQVESRYEYVPLLTNSSKLNPQAKYNGKVKFYAVVNQGSTTKYPSKITISYENANNTITIV